VHGSDGTDGRDYSDEEEEIQSDDDDASAGASGKVEGKETAVSDSAGDKGCAEAGKASGGGEDKAEYQVASLGPPTGGPGPAVYIIHNLSKPAKTDQKEDDDPPTVPLKFFSY